MNYLVTGSAGFIGFHLCRRLLNDGHRVVGFDGMTDYYDVTLKQARVAILEAMPGYVHVTGMLEDLDALTSAANHAPPDYVVHLAAQAGVRYSNENPRAYVDSNLVGSFNILELARQTRPKHLLLASSSSVYGANAIIPFAEADKTDEPLSFYAATKKAMESLAHSYAHLHQLPTTAFRFFTVYGPYGRPDMALFKFVDAILKGKPIDVYGDGRMERDFTYVDDLVEAIVRLIDVPPLERVKAQGVVDTLSEHGPYRVVNLGGGSPVKLMDFIETIETALDRPAVRNMMPMQTGDVPRTYATAGLLEALTGYMPSTDIETGVRAFVDWYKAYYRV